MDSLRGMKLVKQLKEVNKLLEYDITVDFDKTKHLSDKAIKKRKLDKEYGLYILYFSFLLNSEIFPWKSG